MIPLSFTHDAKTSSPPNLSDSGNMIVNPIIPALAFLKSDINWAYCCRGKGYCPNTPKDSSPIFKRTI